MSSELGVAVCATKLDRVELECSLKGPMRSKSRKNTINFVKKVCRYKYRRQPLIGNKIHADSGNKDSSNKHGKPVLSCKNVKKAKK